MIPEPGNTLLLIRTKHKDIKTSVLECKITPDYICLQMTDMFLKETKTSKKQTNSIPLQLEKNIISF